MFISKLIEKCIKIFCISYSNLFIINLFIYHKSNNVFLLRCFLIFLNGFVFSFILSFYSLFLAIFAYKSYWAALLALFTYFSLLKTYYYRAAYKFIFWPVNCSIFMHYWTSYWQIKVIDFPGLPALAVLPTLCT